MQCLKVLIMGDSGVGKTSLLTTYTTNEYPGEYIPAVFDKSHVNLIFEGNEFTLGLWDTSGQEDYERLRPLNYPQTDNVKKKWVPEFTHYAPEVPIILLGTKIDLRDNNDEINQTLISYEYGASKAREISVGQPVVYLECSSLNMTGVKSVFGQCIKSTIYSKEQHLEFKKQKSCNIL